MSSLLLHLGFILNKGDAEHIQEICGINYRSKNRSDRSTGMLYVISLMPTKWHIITIECWMQLSILRSRRHHLSCIEALIKTFNTLTCFERHHKPMIDHFGLLQTMSAIANMQKTSSTCLEQVLCKSRNCECCHYRIEPGAAC